MSKLKHFDADTIQDMLSAYALGALDADETHQVEAYLETSAEGRAELQELREIVALLPYAAEPVEPPARTRQNLFARVAASESTVPATISRTTRRPAQQPGMLRRFVMPVALVVVCGMMLFISQVAFGLQSQVEQLARQSASLETTLTRMQGELAQTRGVLATTRQNLINNEQEVNMLKSQLSDAEHILTFMTAPGVAVRQLDATQASEDTSGEMYMRPGHTTAVILFRGLPPLETGKVYQFWLANGSDQVSAGTVQVGEDGLARLVIEAPDAVNDFAQVMLTVEDAPDKAMPGDDVVLEGSL